MRLAAVFVVSFACSGALASEPGQPLDCSDWVILMPGITCQSVIPIDCSGSDACTRGSNLAVDNESYILTVRKMMTGDCQGTPIGRTEIVRRAGQGESIVAYLEDRCSTVLDMAAGSDCTADTFTFCRTYGYSVVGDVLTFDPTAGRLLLPVASTCRSLPPNYCPPGYEGYGTWLAGFSGFATLFEVLQSYAPPASLGFRVPYMPEGMGGADHFDTYWGALGHPIDFTQAHPLQCGYPVTPPKVGDYMSVADTVPTPPPGQGVYYITATTYQGQKRDGRQVVNGKLVGRDPMLLPACAGP